ncbi:MAG TPA: alkaline phosphatase family protein [Rhodanobacter sp.]|nr:alkaline phosphatase family protein [Rhodanobacter sp.]
MKFRVLALAGLAALLSLTGCTGVRPSAGHANHRVAGVAGSDVPLVGVAVTATDGAGHRTQSSPTDVHGHFTMVLKGNGPFVLTAPFNDSDGTPVVVSAVIAPSPDGAAIPRVANLNPLTSLLAQRVLGTALDAAPGTAQMRTARISARRIAQATRDVDGVLHPLFTAFHVPAQAVADPVGAPFYEANADNPLGNVFAIVRFSVHAGTIAVGSGADRTVVSIPASGALSAVVPARAVASALALADGPTTTPIRHVIVIIGENQSFDGLFGGYVPPPGQTVRNLLSEGIIRADGTPGPNFSVAAQDKGAVQTGYTIDPVRAGAYRTLPQPEKTGELDPVTFQTAGGVADPRFPATLPDGPFQITRYVPYNPTGAAVVTGDPVHRFFQMWQQTGGDNHRHDMFTWVAATTGMGGDSKGITPANPSQGGELMGFMNMSTGDAPLFHALAQTYALSDNYHQSVMGGTGDNFFALATGDMPYFNKDGVVATPPANQIENPNPMTGTANFYIQDGYEGGSYVNCSDPGQPGVGSILAFLRARRIDSKCAPGAYYLVNNYDPGYDMSGKRQPIGPNNYTYPPQTVPTIAEALARKGVTWKWYTGGRDPADVKADAAALHVPVAQAQRDQYNNIGDPLTGSATVMTNPALKARLAGLTTFFDDVANHDLPAVSFVVPKNLDSGHPGYSAPASYEAFLRTVLAKVQAEPALWAHTAIVVTTDEGGGHFDTGYIQSLDFFGDGPRIPMLVVSPYARRGAVDHAYYDHASVLKFIERNWRLPPLSTRSRDSLPNPVTLAAHPYQPINTPAVGDLMSMFAF